MLHDGVLHLAPAAPCPTASFVDRDGNQVGQARLDEVAQGVLIRVEFQNLPAGWHGFHIHAVGSCEALDFESAKD